jgi:condensin complex subunit 1
LRLLAITLQSSSNAEEEEESSSSSSSSSSSIFTTITAAIMDLMHSFEHMAALACELCTTTTNSHNRNNDRLAIELLREIARVGTTCLQESSSSGNSSKASGIAFVAPFLHYLAAARPKLVLQHVSHILPLLHQSDSYQLRSAIVQTLAHLLEYLGKQHQQQQQQNQDEVATTTTKEQGNLEDEDTATAAATNTNTNTITVDTTKTRDALLDLLAERAYDVSSFTRAAALKAWIALSNSSTLPKARLLAVTQLAMDRLQDKTVVVRKQAMQVRTYKYIYVV